MSLVGSLQQVTGEVREKDGRRKRESERETRLDEKGSKRKRVEGRVAGRE